MTNAVNVRDFLIFVSDSEHSGENAVLTFDRQFLRSITCEHCGKKTLFNKPAFRLFIDEVKCSDCSENVDRNNFEYIDELSFESEGSLLDLTLEDIGIPRLHIISVRSVNGEYKYYELSGDKVNIMPLISSKEA